MSKHNNVNPGQYKVGGRERPDDLARERMKGSRAESPNRAKKKDVAPKRANRKG